MSHLPTPLPVFSRITPQETTCPETLSQGLPLLFESEIYNLAIHCTALWRSLMQDFSGTRSKWDGGTHYLRHKWVIYG